MQNKEFLVVNRTNPYIKIEFDDFSITILGPRKIYVEKKDYVLTRVFLYDNLLIETYDKEIELPMDMTDYFVDVYQAKDLFNNIISVAKDTITIDFRCCSNKDKIKLVCTSDEADDIQCT